MYGVEAQSSGGGGLAAQTPFADLYFPGAVGIHSGTAGQIGGPGPTASGNVLPSTNLGDMLAMGRMNASGTAATTPVSQQQNHWSSVLDFHNSPAPWILIAILFLYGWLHLTARAKAGRTSASVVL